MKIPEKLKNLTVGVFFGGQSPEHDISIITGQLALDGLKKLGFKAIPIYISTDGAWCVGDKLGTREFVSNIHQRDLYPFQRWSLDTRHRKTQLTLTRRPHFFTRREKIDIDIAFPALHGAYGEDGLLQGLFEVLGVPYAGSGVESCSISMNKGLTKRFFESLNVPTPGFVYFSEDEWKEDQKGILKKLQARLTFPLFVKPAHAGSSIGITRISEDSQVVSAVDSAFQFDSHCVVEDGIDPMVDVTCCVRTDKNGRAEASLVQESKFEGSDFFSYEEKYLKDGGAQFGEAEQQLTIPAELPASVTKEIQQQAMRVFEELDMSGIGRVDFLYNKESKELFAIEVNPLPGTLYHHLWEKSSVTFDQLLIDLLQEALRKHVRGLRKNTYFTSSILSGMKGSKT